MNKVNVSLSSFTKRSQKMQHLICKHSPHKHHVKDSISSMLPKGYCAREKLLSNIFKSTFFLSLETGVP